jgi:hypothetical protein
VGFPEIDVVGGLAASYFGMSWPFVRLTVDPREAIVRTLFVRRACRREDICRVVYYRRWLGERQGLWFEEFGGGAVCHGFVTWNSGGLLSRIESLGWPVVWSVRSAG